MSLVLQIALVADEDLHDVGAGVLSHFSEPSLDVLEGLAIGYIVNKDAAVGSFVVGGSDGLESGLVLALPLLACGIPDLELDAFVVNL